MKLLEVFGILFAITLALVLVGTFFLAYLSPAKAVRIKVNDFGEAHIEAIILTLLVPLMVYSGWRTWRRMNWILLERVP